MVLYFEIAFWYLEAVLYGSNHSSFVLNSPDALSKEKDIDPSGGIFLSLDVESLLANVPIEETLLIFWNFRTNNQNFWLKKSYDM